MLEVQRYNLSNMRKNKKDFNISYEKGDLFKEYLAFSKFIQNAFISKDGWIIDTGNFEICNRELINRIEQKIKKHPFLWKLFFMVA